LPQAPTTESSMRLSRFPADSFFRQDTVLSVPLPVLIFQCGRRPEASAPFFRGGAPSARLIAGQGVPEKQNAPIEGFSFSGVGTAAADLLLTKIAGLTQIH
jgi:hypothetical protein